MAKNWNVLFDDWLTLICSKLILNVQVLRRIGQIIEMNWILFDHYLTIICCCPINRRIDNIYSICLWWTWMACSVSVKLSMAVLSSLNQMVYCSECMPVCKVQIAWLPFWKLCHWLVLQRPITSYAWVLLSYCCSVTFSGGKTCIWGTSSLPRPSAGLIAAAADGLAKHIWSSFYRHTKWLDTFKKLC